MTGGREIEDRKTSEAQYANAAVAPDAFIVRPASSHHVDRLPNGLLEIGDVSTVRKDADNAAHRVYSPAPKGSPPARGSPVFHSIGRRQPLAGLIPITLSRNHRSNRLR